MVVHRAAHVHEQQDLHIVVALGHHLDVKETRIGSGGADGVGQVEFFDRAFACKFAQSTQGHLDVAGAQFLGIVVIFVGALLPHFDGAAVAAFTADAHTLRVVAAVAKWGCAAGANPFVAALMSFFLLFKPFFERLHQLVPAHFVDGCFLLGREFFFQDFLKPVERHVFGELGQHFNAFEVRTKGFVELVKVFLIFDHHGAAQMVKVVNAAGVRCRAHHVGL